MYAYTYDIHIYNAHRWWHAFTVYRNAIELCLSGARRGKLWNLKARWLYLNSAPAGFWLHDLDINNLPVIFGNVNDIRYLPLHAFSYLPIYVIIHGRAAPQDAIDLGFIFRLSYSWMESLQGCACICNRILIVHRLIYVEMHTEILLYNYVWQWQGIRNIRAVC